MLFTPSDVTTLVPVTKHPGPIPILHMSTPPSLISLSTICGVAIFPAIIIDLLAISLTLLAKLTNLSV